MPPKQVGEHAIALLTDPKYEPGIAYSFTGDTGLVLLDS